MMDLFEALQNLWQVTGALLALWDHPTGGFSLLADLPQGVAPGKEALCPFELRPVVSEIKVDYLVEAAPESSLLAHAMEG